MIYLVGTVTDGLNESLGLLARRARDDAPDGHVALVGDGSGVDGDVSRAVHEHT